ncbi:hypothetical protein B0J12DRAFT_661620 [Macrophomina phaseolina]|uniref:Uncharacterized protein n=1 Tax=Macrophomina phaseolina TaxID=35725 RepID=A0ABQ8GB73_9PEZI|nr:hypothetical protein B0J12DRAFT_661620 [Macrophomina phaseolina]
MLTGQDAHQEISCRQSFTSGHAVPTTLDRLRRRWPCAGGSSCCYSHVSSALYKDPRARGSCGLNSGSQPNQQRSRHRRCSHPPLSCNLPQSNLLTAIPLSHNVLGVPLKAVTAFPNKSSPPSLASLSAVPDLWRSASPPTSKPPTRTSFTSTPIESRIVGRHQVFIRPFYPGDPHLKKKKSSRRTFSRAPNDHGLLNHSITVALWLITPDNSPPSSTAMSSSPLLNPLRRMFGFFTLTCWQELLPCSKAR